VIKNVYNKIVSNKNDPDYINHYFILMILTDGIINDMAETSDILVECAYVPLSVIIIGIGNANFENMDTLDGNDEPLISTDGIKRQRDIVKFVRFEDCRNDPEKISEELLDEVPRQIIDFYTMNNINLFTLN